MDIYNKITITLVIISALSFVALILSENSTKRDRAELNEILSVLIGIGGVNLFAYAIVNVWS